MPPSAVDPPFDQFLATAEAVARARPEVDLEMAREVFLEVATRLHNGLALDGLDEHDANAVVAGLCVDLVAEDPGAAVRARSRATLEAPGDLHEPDVVSGRTWWRRRSCSSERPGERVSDVTVHEEDVARTLRGDDMDLFEIDETQHVRREEAAARLHALADALARNNKVEFERAGRRITVRVPDEVDLKVEVELGDDKNELEIELTW